MMSPSCSLWSTKFRASKANAALRVAGQTIFKEIEPTILNLIARNSKKGGNADPRQTAKPHGSGLGTTRWYIERSLAWLHQFRKLKTREEKYPFAHEALMLVACSVICHRFLSC